MNFAWSVYQVESVIYYERILMLKQTIQLFVKALIIGILVNLTLLYVAGMPLSANQTAVPRQETQTLKQTTANPEPSFPDQ